MGARREKPRGRWDELGEGQKAIADESEDLDSNDDGMYGNKY
jgi:hypothetical protein